jgi:hypothetical protein
MAIMGFGGGAMIGSPLEYTLPAWRSECRSPVSKCVIRRFL